MALYNVLVTGTAYVEVEADSAAHAQQIAGSRLGEMRFGIWDMSMDFVCDEEDLIEENAE
jgi:hypothetical protein